MYVKAQLTCLPMVFHFSTTPCHVLEYSRSWNANSGDTGGLVSNNWISIEWRKVNFLESIGLKPDYLAQASPMTISTLSVPLPLSPVRVEGAALVDSSGNPIKFRGFNWFGFNNGGEMVNGLWSDDPLQSDFATVVRRQRNLGFNAVRLPFAFPDLAIAPARSYQFDCPALPTAEEIGASVTPPGQDPISAPELPSPPVRTPGKCNDYLPSSSVRDRFLWVVKFFVDNGFYVMIDNHAREDQTYLEDRNAWIQQWSALAEDILSDPDVSGRVIFDILNEPDNQFVRWEPVNGKPGLKDLYIDVMDEIYSVAADAIFAIEGTGQVDFGLNWGGKPDKTISLKNIFAIFCFLFSHLSFNLLLVSQMDLSQMPPFWKKIPVCPIPVPSLMYSSQDPIGRIPFWRHMSILQA